jgi:hypothetical protein
MPTFLAVLATTCLLAKGLAVRQSARSTASMTPVIGAVAAKPPGWRWKVCSSFTCSLMVLIEQLAFRGRKHPAWSEPLVCGRFR